MSFVRLRTIAEKLGCSRTTVSYALRNHPCISGPVRARIQQEARKLGWRPNAELSRHLALVRASGKNNLPNVAIVMNKPRPHLVEEHVPRRQLEGATRRLQELGYNPDLINLAETPLSPARLRSVLRARGIQGVVFIATTGPAFVLSKAHLQVGAHFASAVVGVRYPDPPYHVALTNLHTTGYTVITELTRAGFRRPGAVLPRGLDRTLAWAFGAGLQAGAFTLPPENRIEPCYVGEDETHLPEYSFAEIGRWIRREKPDVLITSDTLYLRKCLAQLGPPASDLRVCSLSYVPGVTQDFGLNERDEEVGAAAVDVVVAQLHRGELGVPAVQRTVQIEGVWVGHGAGQEPVAAAPAKRKRAAKVR